MSLYSRRQVKDHVDQILNYKHGQESCLCSRFTQHVCFMHFLQAHVSAGRVVQITVR